jgi:chloramphenicol O-acetyltransferase type A
MGHYLDIENWSRRELFEFFIGYSNPYFNVCAQLDVTRLKEFASQQQIKISQALHYFALRIANETEPFRYRLKDNKVFVWDVVHGGTTVLLPNESFSYAYFDYQRNFEDFMRDMGKAVESLRTGSGKLKPTMRDDVIYHTSLPWISFTSFSHARTPGRGESIPRIVFGKFRKDHDRWLMPFSVEVHHALMDGLHVGRYLSRFEEALADPALFVGLEESVPPASAGGSNSQRHT